MEELTTRKLLEIHNGRCAPADRLDGWKKPKADLIERIRVLGDPGPEQSEPDAAEAARDDAAEPGEAKEAAPGIGAAVREMLLAGEGYEAIVDAVRARFPDARTTRRSVASIACRLRRAGEPVGSRRPVKA